MGRTERLAQPETFGRYQLIAKLAQGRMGDVYKAKSHGVEGFERVLVVKTINPGLAAVPGFVDIVVEEAQRAVMLSHANVAQVLNLGKEDDSGTVYIAGELVNGMDLARARDVASRAQTPWPQDLSIFIASEIANGLDYAHRRKDYNFNKLNLIHRDLTPQNIMLSSDGDVKITDFGIGRAMDIVPPTDDQERLRRAIYSAPEVARQEAAYQQSDIFSLGIILLEMLTGQHPYQAPSVDAMIQNAMMGNIPALSQFSSLPKPLAHLLEGMLQVDPHNRINSVGQVYEELVSYIFGNNLKVDARTLAVFIQELRKDEDQLFPERIAEDAGIDEISLGDLHVPESVQSFFDEEESEAIAEATHDALPRHRLQQMIFGEEPAPKAKDEQSALPGALEEYFRAARAGQGKAVLLSGQLGAGREYLPDRLTDVLNLRGNTQAFAAQAMPDDMFRPAGVIGDLLLDATLKQLPQDNLPTRQDALDYIRTLGLPEQTNALLGAIWGINAFPSAGYLKAQQLLSDACHKLLTKLCQRAIVVFIVDRIEHLDKLSLDVLRLLLPQLSLLPTMLIMATQSADTMRNQLDTTDPEHLKSVKVTGNNPPKLANTKDLSPDSLAILHTLAVAEQPLSQADLTRILGLPSNTIIQLVKELVEFGIVRVPTTGVFLSAIPELVLWIEQRQGRQEIRKRAEALVRYVDHHGAQVPQLQRRPSLTRLLARAGERRRMLVIAQQHIDQLHQAGFLRTCLAFQKSTSDMIATADLGLPQARVEMALSYIELALDLAHIEDARTGISPLPAICEQIHDEVGAAKTQLLQGHLLMRQDDLEEAFIHYKRASQAAQALQNPDLVARTQLALAGFYERYGDNLSAQRMIEGALNLFSQWGTARIDLAERAALSSRAIHIWCARGMNERAQRAVEEMHRLADIANIAVVTCRLDSAQARLSLARGDYQSAHGLMTRAEQLAQENGLTALTTELARQHISYAIDAQDTRVALSKLDQLLTTAQTTQDLYSYQRALEMQAFLMAMQGQNTQAAITQLQNSLQRATQRQIPKDIYRCHSFLAQISLRYQRHQDAQKHKQACAQLAQKMRYRTAS